MAIYRSVLMFFALAMQCVFASASAWAQREARLDQWKIRLELEDGSLLHGVAKPESLAIRSKQLDGGPFVPSEQLEFIAKVEGGLAKLEFANGDSLRGSFALPHLKLQTQYGTLQIPTDEILRVVHKIQVPQVPEAEIPPLALPRDDEPAKGAAGEPPELDFGGLRWSLWRTEWNVIDGRLTAVGRVRDGFNYGHWGDGRGGMAITANGNKRWKDYEVAFDFKMIEATKDFFHASIAGESRGMHVYVRCQGMTESWNAPDTAYVVGINTKGQWSLAAYEGFGYQGPGWTPAQIGTVEPYTAGKMESPFLDVNRLKIRVRGSEITLWLNEELLTTFEHPEDAAIPPLTYGGVGVEWRFESLGWIGNFEHRKL